MRAVSSHDTGMAQTELSQCTVQACLALPCGLFQVRTVCTGATGCWDYPPTSVKTDSKAVEKVEAINYENYEEKSLQGDKNHAYRRH